MKRETAPCHRWKALWAVMIVAAALSHSSQARADELEEFQLAKNAYDAQNYALAVQRFEPLVSGPVPKLRSRPLLLESRKYLAASYLFVGKRSSAEAQFERLLREDGNYQLDPVAFSTEVLDLFTSVRNRLRRERTQVESERESADKARKRVELARRESQRERLNRLIALAETEHVVHENSRWLAAIPFGVGQFQNGERGLGTALAITEVVLLGVSVASFKLHESLRDVSPNPAKRDNAQFAEEAFRVTNWISTGALIAVMAGGIIDAQLRYKPTGETLRKRTLDPSLTRDLGVSFGPKGMALTGRF